MASKRRRRMNEQTETVCRFCLDGTKTPTNPLLDPCECRGSIQFVHKQCLMRWRQQDIERNGEVCLLCNTEYKIPLVTDLESIPEKQLIYIYLDNPIVSNMLAHYVWVLVGLFSESIPGYRHIGYYSSFQLCNHTLLVTLLIQRTKIQNWQRYLQKWSMEYRWLICIFHGAVLFSSLFGSSELSYCVSNCILQVYWKIHLDILDEINAQVLDLNYFED
jgi:hypothetical protein